jgi:hypothetical protein
LKLARRHGVKLPADTVESLRAWYNFTDFSILSRCMWRFRTACAARTISS